MKKIIMMSLCLTAVMFICSSLFAAPPDVGKDQQVYTADVTQISMDPAVINDDAQPDVGTNAADFTIVIQEQTGYTLSKNNLATIDVFRIQPTVTAVTMIKDQPVYKKEATRSNFDQITVNTDAKAKATDKDVIQFGGTDITTDKTEVNTDHTIIQEVGAKITEKKK